MAEPLSEAKTPSSNGSKIGLDAIRAKAMWPQSRYRFLASPYVLMMLVAISLPLLLMPTKYLILNNLILQLPAIPLLIILQVLVGFIALKHSDRLFEQDAHLLNDLYLAGYDRETVYRTWMEPAFRGWCHALFLFTFVMLLTENGFLLLIAIIPILSISKKNDSNPLLSRYTSIQILFLRKPFMPIMFLLASTIRVTLFLLVLVVSFTLSVWVILTFIVELSSTLLSGIFILGLCMSSLYVSFRVAESLRKQFNYRFIKYARRKYGTFDQMIQKRIVGEI